MINKNKRKILIYDIETSPILAYVWGWYEQNVIKEVKSWHMLSFSYRWYGENKTYAFSLPDFEDDYAKDKDNDYALVKKLRDLVDEADIIVAHNGDQFDLRKLMARIVYHDIAPPSPVVSIDTKKAAKKYFAFESNSLKDLAKKLRVGEKMETGGFGLWEACMSGDKDAWKKMVKYNKMDVIVLEKIYERLLPFIRNHPNIALTHSESCSHCSSINIQKRGFAITKSGLVYQRYVCNDCRAWGQYTTLLDKPDTK